MAFIARNGASGFPSDGQTIYIYEAGTTITTNVGQLKDLEGTNLSNPFSVPSEEFWGFEPETRIKLDVYWQEQDKYLVKNGIFKDPYQPSDVGLGPEDIWGALGVWVGNEAPVGGYVSYQTWKSTGTGYFTWLDISNSTAVQNIVAVLSGGTVAGGSSSTALGVKVGSDGGLVVSGAGSIATTGSGPEDVSFTSDGGVVIGGDATISAVFASQSVAFSTQGGVVIGGTASIQAGSPPLQIVAMDEASFACYQNATNNAITDLQYFKDCNLHDGDPANSPPVNLDPAFALRSAMSYNDYNGEFNDLGIQRCLFVFDIPSGLNTPSTVDLKVKVSERFANGGSIRCSLSKATHPIDDDHTSPGPNDFDKLQHQEDSSPSGTPTVPAADQWMTFSIPTSWVINKKGTKLVVCLREAAYDTWAIPANDPATNTKYGARFYGFSSSGNEPYLDITF